jgi:hypothetical protein
MPTSGFQQNTTITSAFWAYFPAAGELGNIVMVEVNNIQYIEASQDYSKVWIYYPSTSVSTSQTPLILTGAVAQTFMADFGALFA